MNDRTEDKRLLEALAGLSRYAGARPAYVQGGGGNSSVKLSAGRMAIKASGFLLRQMTAEDGYSVVPYDRIRSFYKLLSPADSGIEEAGQALIHDRVEANRAGEVRRPSVEMGFHALLGRFVLHTHSVYANLLCCARRGRVLAAEILGPEAETRDGKRWDWIPYTNPGFALALLFRPAAEAARKEGADVQIFLMQNHGLAVTADTAEACQAAHEALNRRVAERFHLCPEAYPAVGVREEGGLVSSDTPYLDRAFTAAREKGRPYDAAFFHRETLYPDQLVFLEKVRDGADGEEPAADEALIGPDGKRRYRMSAAKAQVIEETLTALVCIFETLEREGLAYSRMSADARSFIENWEAEAYRRKLAQGSAR